MPKLVSTWGLSQLLDLPAPWLRTEALAGRIPCLKAGRKLRFNPEAVEKALAERAASEHAAAPAPSQAQG